VLVGETPRAEARLRVRQGSGVALRRRAVSVAAADDGWDQLVVPFGATDVLAQELASYGPAVVALEPPAVVEAVVRRLRGVLGESA
jgi:proteasome accessory factor B